MRILISGGAGFIGSHVAEQLIAAGHDVGVIDNLSTGRVANLPAQADFYEADIRTGCEEVFRAFRPDLLSHHAAQMDVRRSVREPLFDADVNILGTIKLLENCIRFGVRRVIFASSGGAIYGEQETFPADENDPAFPVSPYGVSKLAGERYLHFYAAEYGLEYVALRYANVYGPRQDPHGEAGVVAIFGGNFREGRASTIYGTGNQTRDYIYVKDVARANVLVVGSRGYSGPFNIGTGVETSVNQLYRTMQQVAGSNLAAVYEPGRPGEQLRSSIDSRRALHQFGWAPSVTLAEGLRDTLKALGVS